MNRLAPITLLLAALSLANLVPPPALLTSGCDSAVFGDREKSLAQLVVRE